MRILVAEHNPQSRDFLKQVLQSEGYFVSAVSDGSEAIIGVNQEKPDLIISNPTLPELNGHEFCRQVKADSA